MLRATFKSLLARKVRLVLSAIAVVVGISFISGTLVLTDTLNKTFDNLFGDIYKNVSVQVRSVNAVDTNSGDDTNRPPLPASLVNQLRTVGGVRAAVGNVGGVALLVNPRTHKALDLGGAPGIGGNWTGDSPTSSVALTVGGRAPRPGEIVVDKGSADKAKLHVGDRVTVLTKGPPETFTLVGTFTLGGKSSLGGASVTDFDTATAQRLLMAPGQYSSIDLAAQPGVSATQLRAAVAKALPDGVQAVTGKQVADENASAIEKAVSGLSTFLLVFAGIAVFVAAFIIINTFNMLIAQRTRELAMLRALGASRRQVRVSVLVEAALVGFIGATVGLAIGIGLAVLLKGLFSLLGASLPSGSLVFAARTPIVAYVVGIVVTTVAAYIPARKAATVPPVAAMRDTYVIPDRSLRLRAILGSILTVVGALVLVRGLSVKSGTQSASLVGLGAAACFIGVATLSPWLSRPITRVIGAPLPRLFGATGRLGRENAMRNPRRTASTASALMIGLALVSAFGVLGQSIKAGVRETVQNSVGADFFLEAQGFGSGISPTIVHSLQGKPGIDVATGLRADQAKVGGKTVGVLAGDPSALTKVLILKKVHGDLSGLATGTVLVSDDTATNRGFHVGQSIPVTFPNGVQSLRIAGTYAKSQLAGNYLLATSEFVRHYRADLDIFGLVRMKDGADRTAVRAEVEAAAKPYANVEVKDQSELIRQQEKTVDQTLSLIYVLLALAILIALFGIVNTLALSVIERTREVGLLRAVGMGRRQLRTMVRLEAVVIAAFGAVLGVAVGSFFGWALATALKKQQLAVFSYPIALVVGIVVVGGLLGVLAAIFPARRAAKMDILRAIATT
jgi:putative ABC transport system permease protein